MAKNNIFEGENILVYLLAFGLILQIKDTQNYNQ